MKRIIALITIIALAASALCSCCSHESEKEATCTEPEVCVKCGDIITEAKGHTPDHAATCTEPSTCTVCGEVIEEAKGHTYPADYSCETGAVCAVCGVSLAEPCEHTPAENATCEEDLICTVCKKVLVPASEHTANIEKATCTAPSVCTKCGKVLEEAKGHTPGPEATVTSPQICTVCGATIVPAKGSSSGDEVFIAEAVSGGHYVDGKSDYNSRGTVLHCGNYLMEYFGANTAGNSGYASIVSAFAARFPSVNVNSIIVPKCCSFHSPKDRTDRFDAHKAFISSTYSMMTGVKTVDAFGEMAQHRDEYLFYRTDHHWTSLGAYYASVAFCKANGITPRALNTYETVINTGFQGTLYTTYWGSNKPTGIKFDYTVGHIPATPYTFKYSSSGSAMEGTNNGTAINRNAKSYASMFICGDQPFTDIKTENHNGRRLIVFKESYGNAFVPYMIDYFEEIIVIDIRSSTASVKAIIEKYGITDAIIINNIQAVSGMAKTLEARLKS